METTPLLSPPIVGRPRIVGEVHLSVIIPAYNEERRIGKTLAKIRKYLDSRGYSYEIIVSDDGSRDTTIPIVKIIQEGWPQLRLLAAVENKGKGAAVKRAMLNARGKYLLFTDADNATPLEEIEKLWPYTDTFPVVFGSRHIKGAHIHIHQATHRKWLSRASNLLIRFVAVPGIWDTQCGFKLFERNAGKNIFANVKLDRFGFDIEAFVIAKQLGYPFKEIGIEWYNDPDTRVRTGREAIRTLTDLFRIKLNMLKGKYDRVGYIQDFTLPRRP
jgi:dolichyl-phosphate beta-glucosyltransferase